MVTQYLLSRRHTLTFAVQSVYSPFNIIANTVVTKAASAPLVAPGGEYLPPNIVVPTTPSIAGQKVAASNATSPPPGAVRLYPPPGPATHAHAAYHYHGKGESVRAPLSRVALALAQVAACLSYITLALHFVKHQC